MTGSPPPANHSTQDVDASINPNTSSTAPAATSPSTDADDQAAAIRAKKIVCPSAHLLFSPIFHSQNFKENYHTLSPRSHFPSLFTTFSIYKQTNQPQQSLESKISFLETEITAAESRKEELTTLLKWVFEFPHCIPYQTRPDHILSCHISQNISISISIYFYSSICKNRIDFVRFSLSITLHSTA